MVTTASIKTQNIPAYDENFFEATRDLLTGWTKGNMIPFQYSHPLSPEDPVRGALLWEEFALVHKGYYQSYEAESLIEKASAELIKTLGHPIKTLVDIGPGPIHSIEMKTAKLLSALSPLTYKPTDVALPYLESAKTYAEKNYPKMSVKPTIRNFLDEDGYELTNEDDFFFIDGSTLLNIPEDDPTPNAYVGLVRNLNNLRRFMAPGTYLGFVHDANQNETSLRQLYGHPIQDAFILNVLYRIVRDLPISGFYPSAFSYEFAWLPEKHLVAHRAVSTKQQDVVLGDMKISIHKGQKLQLTHSFKLPSSDILAAANEAGFLPIKSWDNGNDRLFFQLLRSVS